MRLHKKLGVLLLVMVLLMVMIVSCSQPQDVGSDTPSTTPPASSEKPTAEEELPKDQGQGPPDELTYWHAMDVTKVSPLYTDYAEAPLYQWLMEATNTKITFIHPPAGQEQESFSLMISSGEYPDIIERDFTNTSNYPGGADKAIEDGVIIALNDAMEKGLTPNLVAYFDQHPEWKSQWVSDSGNYVCFPFIRQDPILWSSWGPQVRLDWLEELDLGFGIDNLPNTIAEWDTILRAFKNKGYVEYPLLITELSSWGDNGSLPGAWGVGWEWYADENGELQYGPAQSAFREYLNQMITWNKDGLVDPDWVSKVDTENLRSKIMGDKVAVYFTNVGGGIGYYYDTLNAQAGAETVPNHPANFRSYGMPHPVLNEGDKSRFGGSALAVAGMSAFISAQCKNVEAACRFLDYGYSEEGFIMYNFGKEGVSFDYINHKEFDSPIDLSEFGDRFPRWNEEVYKPKDGYPLAVSLSRFVRSHSSGPFAQSKAYLAQFLPYYDQLATIDVWVNSSDFTGQLLPRMYFTSEESSVLAARESDLKTYKDETLMAFLQGSVPLDDTTWAEFQDNLKTMGLEEILKIRRAAYARAKAR